MKANETLGQSLIKAAKRVGKDSEAVEAAIEKFVNNEKEIQQKAANEVFEGGNTGFGAEIRTPVVYESAEYSFINRQSQLLSKLNGDNGQVAGDSLRLANVGEMGYFDVNAEITGSHEFISMTPTHAPRTDNLLINLRKHTAKVAISAEEMRRTSEANIPSLIMGRIRAAADKTIESSVLNMDTDATATNINFSGQVVPASYHENASGVAGNDGLRKTAIAAGLTTGDATTAFSRSTYQNMMRLVKNYANDPSQLLWIFNNDSSIMARYLSEFSTQEVYGQATNSTPGFIGAPEGIEAYTSREYAGRCETDGSVASNGTFDAYGRLAQTSTVATSLMLIHRQAVQYAFGQDMRIVAHETAEGILYDVAYRFGAAIANNKAGLGATVGMGIVQAA